MKSTIWLLGTLCVSACLGEDPFAPGVHEVTTLRGRTESDTNVTWDYVAKVPEGVEGAPVLVWVTGWGGMLPSEMYDELSVMLGRKGVASVVLWRVGGPQPRVDGRSLVDAISYLQGHLGAGNVDWDLLALGGHSAGNHVWCDYLQYSCTPVVKGVVMMDPVDGYDPFGIVNNYCTSETQKLNFTLPALLMSTGLDPAPGPEGVPCAPANMSNTRFFHAWSGPIWMVNATAYGHLDVCDPEIEEIGTIICAADDSPKLPYKHQVAGLTKAFFQLLSGDDTVPVLTNTTAMPVHSISTVDANGWNPPYPGGCRRV